MGPRTRPAGPFEVSGPRHEGYTRPVVTYLLLMLGAWCAGPSAMPDALAPNPPAAESRRAELPADQPPEAACVDPRARPASWRCVRSWPLTTLCLDPPSVTPRPPLRPNTVAAPRRPSATLQEIRVRLQI